MQKTAFRLRCADGHQMPVYGWLPEGPPIVVLHIAHGMAEYAERYAPVAEMLVQKAIAVYAHDHRAHGKAVIGDDDLGITGHDWFNKQVDDTHLLVQHLRKQYPQQKIFLLGHSMGSFINQRFFQRYGNEIDGLILSASNGKKDPLMDMGIAVAKLQLKLFGVRYRSHLIDTLSFKKFNNAFKPVRTPHDWLSRDPHQVDAYYADPKCGFICSALFFYYFFRGISDAFKKANINAIPTTVPVYAFAGDKDPVGLFGKGFLELVNAWKKAGVKDISYKLYPGGRHEMLNEINRIEVIDDLLGWIKKRI